MREFCIPLDADESDRFVAIHVSDNSLYPNVEAGQYAIIKITDRVRETDLAAVFTNDGWLVRFVHLFAPGLVRLEAANPDYPDRYYTHHQIAIMGVMTGTGSDEKTQSPYGEAGLSP